MMEIKWIGLWIKRVFQSKRKNKVMGNECYANRELSWLKFNERVLEEAADDMVPLCERLSFISIFQSNLDEFFMVRVGTLTDQLILKEEVRDNKTNMTCMEQINAILKETENLCRKRDTVYQEIMGQIANHGFKLLSFHELLQVETEYLEKYFQMEVLPLLSPMIVGRKQPFPFMKNKEIYAVVVLETIRGKEKIGIIPCSSGISERMIAIPSLPGCYILLEELILHFVPMIFNQYNVRGKSLVKITRNGDINAEAMIDEDLNYRDMMEEIIKMRKKLAPVRLELTRELDIKVVQVLCDNLGLNNTQVFTSNVPLDLGFTLKIRDLLRENHDLFFDRYLPKWPDTINKNQSIMEQVKEKDILLTFPYETMKPFLVLLHEAASDKDVVSIKMTLYRLAKQSKVVDALIEAAENGKEVIVLVELSARFDEENNIEWSRRLEESGCIVIYGIDEVKVHSKLCLITRKCNTKIEYITQVGTGNYNENTALLYTDLSFITADYEIGLDAASVFHTLLMGELPKPTKHLLMAPNGLQNKLIELIDEEIAYAQNNQKAYIGIKINSLTDIVLIKKLIEASLNGVKIDLIVRGICCLLPGIEGVTENIRIISIVGRYLEHSRIFMFGDGESEKIYIASADWMTRNTLKRIEAAVPVYDSLLKNRIREMFKTMLKDTVKARNLDCDGSYHRAGVGKMQLNSQELFCNNEGSST